MTKPVMLAALVACAACAHASGPPADGQALIRHLYHSGFAVRTAGHLLIFDYWPGAQAPSGGSSAGVIDPREIAGENVVVFISHEHTDHFDPAVIEWAESVEQIHYVVSPEVVRADKRFAPGQMVTVVGAGETVSIGEITVESTRATDSGVAFLVRVDGLSMYHSGDHAAWNWDSDPDATAEFVSDYLDFLDGETIDIAMHVCDPRLRNRGWGGVIAFAETFQPTLLIPMHSKGNYDAFTDIATVIDSLDLPVRFWPVASRGDSTTFGFETGE